MHQHRWQRPDGCQTDDRLDPDERVVGVGDEGDAVALESVPLHDTFWFVWFAFRPDTVIAGT